MKYIYIILTICFLSSCNSFDFSGKEKKLDPTLKKNLIYIANLLNEDIPNYWYKISIKKGFNLNTKEDVIIGLNIYDLNTGIRNNSNFLNNHIYHISPINFDKSFSYILCVFQNKMYLFKAINCLEKGNTLDEVLSFLKSNFPDDISSDTYEKLNNYRDYGNYIRIDAMTSLNCDYLK